MTVTEPANESIKEEPIVVLRQNHDLLLMCLLFICFIIVFFIFGVIIPAIKAGSYSAVWGPASANVKKIFLFYCALLSTPILSYQTMLAFRRNGNFFFYTDRMEFESFWFGRKACIPYNQMHVSLQSMFLMVSTETIPPWKSYLRRLKAEFYAFGFPTIFLEPKVGGVMIIGLSKKWENPKDGPKAVQILKEKAFSVTNI